ncbi:MAG: elongation factor P [Bacilli bacterium]|nr:elongation factor P [Bacilli bacterium]MDD3305139.1 elongation factor P [Bacilli bacterium]MDD4053677.1 elongation factor P [Bacilli bacterium]MDD4411176.1 elongation factor P [Bacilli bacterium]
MINVNDFKNGITIVVDDNIFQVVEFQHVKPGKGPAFVRTKLKNLRTGANIDHTFNAGIKVERALIDKKAMQYLYNAGDNYVFMNMETYEQLEINKKDIAEQIDYLKENLDVELVFYKAEMISVNLPEKIEMLVTSTEPAIKGNTATTAQKDATVETGLVVKVPLFVDEGETIIVSTKDGKYVSRK